MPSRCATPSALARPSPLIITVRTRSACGCCTASIGPSRRRSPKATRPSNFGASPETSASHEIVRPSACSSVARSDGGAMSTPSSAIQRALPRRRSSWRPDGSSSPSPSGARPVPGDSPALWRALMMTLAVMASARRASTVVRGSAGGLTCAATPARLHRGRERQQPRGVAVDGHAGHQHRSAFGERAGLVERHHGHVMRDLQRLGVLDEDAVARGHAGAHHQRGRRGQAERARTGDDQHGHGIEHGALPVARGHSPAQQRGQRGHAHHRHEHGADAVDQVLDGRLLLLRRSTSRTMRASVDSAPTAVTSTSSRPGRRARRASATAAAPKARRR